MRWAPQVLALALTSQLVETPLPALSEIGVVVATFYGVIAAVIAAGLFAILNLGWRGTARNLEASMVVCFASLPITIPLLLITIGMGTGWAVSLMIAAGVLAAMVFFAISTRSPLALPWAVRVAGPTGAGPVGLWLLATGRDDKTLQAYADARRARSVTPESMSLGEEMEQVLLIRQAFANGTQSQTSWIENARAFPDAGIEYARAIRSTDAQLAIDILKQHRAQPIARIRRAAQRA